jgi:hypothetical protein
MVMPNDITHQKGTLLKCSIPGGETRWVCHSYLRPHVFRLTCSHALFIADTQTSQVTLQKLFCLKVQEAIGIYIKKFF